MIGARLIRPLLLAIVLASGLVQTAGAREEIVAGLSQNRVSITATFVGSEILVYGAVKRTEEPPEEPLEVAIVIEGPSREALVRRKERRFGIWMNTESHAIDAAPTFYAVSTTGPFEDVISPFEDQMRAISVPRMIEVAEARDPASGDFAEALRRIRTNSGLYTYDEGGISLREQTLFSASFDLPANLTEGFYRARIFLTRDGNIVSYYTTRIDVRKVGLEKQVYSLAHDDPWIYGLLSLAIAIFAGWAASTLFRLIMRN